MQISGPVAAGIIIASGFLPLSAAAEIIGGLSISPTELSAMKAEYKRPQPRPAESKALVGLGRLLFWDPRASASGKTACASCHFPQLGWAVTDPRSRNDSGKLTSRRSQPLLGVGYIDAPVGWDGRNPSLEAQAKSSIASGSMSMRETDTPVKVEVIEGRFQNIPNMFPCSARPCRTPPSISTRSSRRSRHMSGHSSRASRHSTAGSMATKPPSGNPPSAAVFSSIATRIALPATAAGVSPTTNFMTSERRPPTGGAAANLKDDEDMQFAFKTPTLRAVALRPPYMHNGSSIDLYAAVKHYEKGGIDRPSRSPLLVPVALSEQDRSDLVAFLRTLSGVEGEGQPALPAVHVLPLPDANCASLSWLRSPGIRMCQRDINPFARKCVCDQAWRKGQAFPCRSESRSVSCCRRSERCSACC